MYLVFALDATIPMNQKMDELSFLDCSKNAIEFMFKLRQKDVSSRSLDKYLLVTGGPFPQCIKSLYLKDSQLNFLEELKNINAMDIGSPLSALTNAFKILNLLRLQASADHYAQGLYPASFDNAVIVYFSSGCWHKESMADLSKESLLGNELIDSPLRWDYSLVSYTFPYLHSSGTEPSSPVTTLRGIHQKVPSQKYLMMHMEKTNRTQIQIAPPISGIPFFFFVCLKLKEKRYFCRCVNPTDSKSTFEWPLPESFPFEDKNIPIRLAQPEYIIAPLEKSLEPYLDLLSWDYYKMESEKIFKGELEKNVLYSVSISYNNKTYPFGIIRRHRDGTHYILQVSAFNFPILTTWIHQIPSLKNSVSLPQEFFKHLQDYIDSIPSYYYPSLFNFFRRKNFGAAFSERIPKKPLNPSVSILMRSLKNSAKSELDQILNHRNHYHFKGPISSKAILPEIIFDPDIMHISRSKLIEQIEVNRKAIIKGFVSDIKSEIKNEIMQHNMTVSLMGDFMSPKYRRESLRPVFDDAVVRTKPFGSPYKVDKQLSIDEADMIADIPEDNNDTSSVSSGSSSLGGKRTLLSRVRAMKKRLKSSSQNSASDMELSNAQVIASEINKWEFERDIQKFRNEIIECHELAFSSRLDLASFKTLETLALRLKTESPNLQSFIPNYLKWASGRQGHLVMHQYLDLLFPSDQTK